MGKMLIIDGNSVLNRAFYGIRPLSAPDGTPTAAVYGMTNMLLSRLGELEGEGEFFAAAAFDMRAPTFRHKRFEGYKATRHGMPDDLAVQLPLAKDMCRALGIAALEKEGYEADDILGTLAEIASEAGHDVYIYTGDRDSLQLIRDGGEGGFVHVLLAGSAAAADEYDCEKFREKYSVAPPLLVDIKALMGDSSDNIPGVGGIGEKTAVKLIAELGSLDGVYKALDAVTDENGGLPKKLTGLFPAGASVAAALLRDRETAYLSRELAEIFREVPLDLSLDDLRRDGFDRPALAALCRRLGFSALIKKLSLDTEEENTATKAKSDAEAGPAAEFSETENVSAEFLASLDASAQYAVGITEESGALLGGIALTVRVCDGSRRYVCEGISPEDAAAFICSHRVILRDGKETVNLLRSLGAEVNISPEHDIFDVSLAAYVLDSTAQDYSPSALASARGIECPDDESAMSALMPILCDELEKSGQSKIYREIEQPLSVVLADMEKAGFRIDREGLADFGMTISAEADTVEQAIYELAGERFNIASPKQLGEILFERLGLPHSKKTKTKTGYSTAAEILEELRPYHPIIDEILRWRQLSKLRGTYVEGLLAAADENGRIHTDFRQTVTATGRLSSTEPNLQNIPIRTPLGREMRRFFIPSDGYLLIDADYSQIELRLLAVMSGDETMSRAFAEGADIHRITASQVFGVAADEVTEAQRKDAKAVNFGIVYGISDFSLGADLGIGKWRAAEYIASYFATYPGVERYMNETTEKAKADGFVTTLFGRRRYIPELKAGKAALRAFGERVARNSPIQGTAADIMKIAMLRAREAIDRSGIEARLIMQVHDELILEAREDQAQAASDILRQAMEGAGEEIAAALPCDIFIGRTWLDE